MPETQAGYFLRFVRIAQGHLSLTIEDYHKTRPQHPWTATGDSERPGRGGAPRFQPEILTAPVSRGLPLFVFVVVSSSTAHGCTSSLKLRPLSSAR